MTKIWKAVVTIAVALLAFGILCAGTGLLTGASPERVWQSVSGNENAAALIHLVNNLRNTVLLQFVPQ